MASPPPANIPPASVLFLCNRNTIRSPVAEALLKRQMGRAIFVDSAGLETDADGGDAVDPFARAVMAEIGLDLGPHRPKTLEDIDITGFDLALSLTPQAHAAAERLTRASACEVEFWPIADPSLTEGSRETRLAAYRALRDDLALRIARRFPSP